MDSSHHSLHTGTKLLAKMDQNHSTTLFLYNLKIKHVKKFFFGGNMNICHGNMLVFSDMKKTKLFASYCLSKIVILMTLLARHFSICSSVQCWENRVRSMLTYIDASLALQFLRNTPRFFLCSMSNRRFRTRWLKSLSYGHLKDFQKSIF